MQTAGKPAIPGIAEIDESCFPKPDCPAVGMTEIGTVQFDDTLFTEFASALKTKMREKAGAPEFDSSTVGKGSAAPED